MALPQDAWKAFVGISLDDHEIRADPGEPPYLAYWNKDKLGPVPTDAEIQERIAAYDTARNAEANNKATARDAARNSAASAVGKQFTALTQPERTGLLMVLVHRAGGLNPNGTVRPFDEWEVDQ